MNEQPEQQQVEPGPELVPVADAARRLGITERAVRKRITVGTMRGVMIDRAWQVHLAEPNAEPEQGRSSEGSRNRNSSGPVPLTAITAQAQMNALMQEWIAPLTTRIEVLAGENGELRADLRNERERRAVVEQERDDLRRQLGASRPREQTTDSESPPRTTNGTPGGAERVQRSLWQRIADALRGPS